MGTIFIKAEVEHLLPCLPSHERTALFRQYDDSLTAPNACFYQEKFFSAKYGIA